MSKKANSQSSEILKNEVSNSLETQELKEEKLKAKKEQKGTARFNKLNNLNKK
jgi:hypothetical protein